MKDSEVFSGELLCEATATLISVIATIDCVSDPSSPSMELLEAKRAIHNAIVALRGWNRPFPSVTQAHADANTFSLRAGQVDDAGSAPAGEPRYQLEDAGMHATSA